MSQPSRADRITQMIEQKLAPSQLVIRDDSAQHSGHGNVAPGARETHLHITIAAQALVGKTRLQQHKAVLEVVQKEFDHGLHALSIDVVS